MDKERVLEGSPWSFDNRLLLLQEIKGDEQPSEIPFSTSPFWVRVYDVPLSMRDETTARDVGEALEGFLDFDNSNPLGFEKSLRVRALVHVDRPLLRGIHLFSEDGPRWVDFKYERLPDFCFLCGRLDHVERDCPEKEEGGEGDISFVYGPWLRASPRKGVRVEDEGRLQLQNRLNSIDPSKPFRDVRYEAPGVNRFGPPSSIRKALFKSARGKEGSRENSGGSSSSYRMRSEEGHNILGGENQEVSSTVRESCKAAAAKPTILLGEALVEKVPSGDDIEGSGTSQTAAPDLTTSLSMIKLQQPTPQDDSALAKNIPGTVDSECPATQRQQPDTLPLQQLQFANPFCKESSGGGAGKEVGRWKRMNRGQKASGGSKLTGVSNAKRKIKSGDTACSTPMETDEGWIGKKSKALGEDDNVFINDQADQAEAGEDQSRQAQ